MKRRICICNTFIIDRGPQVGSYKRKVFLWSLNGIRQVVNLALFWQVSWQHASAKNLYTPRLGKRRMQVILAY